MKTTPSLGKSLNRGKGVSWALIWVIVGGGRGWGGHLFEVGANSRLGAYSNKYGDYSQTYIWYEREVTVCW